MYTKRLTTEQLYYILNEDVSTDEQKEQVFFELLKRDELNEWDWNDKWADRISKGHAFNFLFGPKKINKAKAPDDPTKYMSPEQKKRWQDNNPEAADQLKYKLPVTGDIEDPSTQIAKKHAEEKGFNYENEFSTNKIKELQTSLNKRGAKVSVDGKFGPETAKAMQQHDPERAKKFQTQLNKHGEKLDVDGKIGPKTFAAFKNVAKQNTENNKSSEPKSTETTSSETPKSNDQTKLELLNMDTAKKVVDDTITKVKNFVKDNLKSTPNEIPKPVTQDSKPVTSIKPVTQSPKPVTLTKAVTQDSKPVTPPKPISKTAETFKKTADTFNKSVTSNLNKASSGFEDASKKLDRLFAGSRRIQ